jgi:hypothetical protein
MRVFYFLVLLFYFYLVFRIKSLDYRHAFYYAIKHRRMVVDAVGEPVTEDYDGHIFFYEPVERCIVAMPPALVINDLVAIGVAEHAPPESVVFDAALFERAGTIGELNCFIIKELILVKRLVPAIHVLRGAVNAFVAIDAICKHVGVANPVAFVTDGGIAGQAF